MELAIKIVDWIFFLTVIASFVVSVRRPGNKDLRPIQVYILMSMLLNTTFKILELFSLKNVNSESALINIFSILEISILYYYFFQRISRTTFKIFLQFLLCVYFITCIIFWVVKYKGVSFYSPILFAYEGILVTAACFFYILEIIKSDAYIDLKANKHFIVSCGILFYFGITVPSYLGLYNLYYLDPIFFKLVIISNYIFYTFLFITFMKAYLCIPTEQQQ
jgi:hypothetical protein